MTLLRTIWSACVLGSVAACTVAACTPQLNVRGYVPDEAKVAEITPGIDRAEDVVDTLGSPSSAATFDERTWYYISRKTESRAFLDEKIIDQRVLAVAFDADGVVTEIRQYGIEDGRVVDLVERSTPTRGNELGFLEQLFGNIGRFNAPDSASGY